MKAVVLAAGEGTRLRPRTADLPKPLVEVNGKPILTHCFEILLDLGIDDVVVVVGYEKDKIIDRYGDSFRAIDIEYAHQSERLGLAHAVLTAEPYVDSDFVVLNGDNIYSANFSEVLAHHTESGADITFPVEEVSTEEATSGAVCELDDDRAVTGLVEKPAEPPSNYAPTAFYVLPPAIFPACRVIRPSERGEYELADAIDLLIYSGYSVETQPFEGWKVNVNTEADITRAEQLLHSGQ
ncbi:glucose-1-phosphate thymidylyltransferase [Halobacterium salinarum NRC-1]|uniref:Glucose-1-phosphate thymidylyltransferase n=3 Tax=Halobacterium salinarum TaxID=2242 RepID=Q9HSV0_HALSA|nr:sugar nucleotidyltransferase [Halobacterium salinarum]AAG18702.1 glucose-1-phosphate thymidylyltransferase [Halobacterium salinarum NRC-1]MBB6091089.1 glucose-1-phosphate thymidylyltransferase [Halobacterium salinarum]UEB92117.1 sugar nucleotidyltransferase [Halobacterium salinarum NRC-34001]CAP12949.1 UTP--glucose-1-phosphate uridylyltransferase AglF [Halobacterium salinarum R1]DAC77389.1 TPA_inf: UTP--glucose-1-phosphate uridylyltransferaseAglF [Halobacterium salinarum NRC-1]